MAAFRSVRVLGALTIYVIASGLAYGGTISTVDGTITVTGAVTQIGSTYQYTYSVSDLTGQLAVLDIKVPIGASITGIAVPGGSSAFSAAYDPGLGLVSFLENGAVFTAAPLSGFMFSTTFGPGTSSFGVTLFDATTGTGSVLGPVQAVTTVPEPAWLSLLGLACGVPLFWRKYSGRHQQGDVK